MNSALHFHRFRHLNQGNWRRIFAIGDVHGCFDELAMLLNKIEFEPQLDLAIFLGDLGDRGPQSFNVFKFVLGKPHFYLIAGNHEDLLVEHLTQSTRLPDDMMSFWIKEEALWVEELSVEERIMLAEQLQKQACFAMELEINNGIRFGLTHAGFDEGVWFQDSHQYDDKQFRLLAWSRQRAETAIADCYPIQGVDYTVHGHTIFPEAAVKANSVFIDTGCCIGNKLTALDLTQFAASGTLESCIYSVPARID